MRRVVASLGIAWLGACSPLPPVHVKQSHACTQPLDAAPAHDGANAADSADVVPQPTDATQDIAPSKADAVAADSVAPAPLTATGQFKTLANVLPLLETDAGVKNKSTPRDSAGLFADLDGDGLLDIVLADGVSRVYVGLATGPWQWAFTTVLQQGEQRGITTLAAIDIDGNGKLAIAVSGALLHLLVRQTDGSWQDEAVARGLVDPVKQMLQGLVVADIDADGLQDLLVTRFSCGPQSRLLAFVNQGDGHFASQGPSLGVDQNATLWNVLPVDVDGDRRPDLLTMVEGCDPQSGNAYLHATAAGKYERLTLAPAFLPEGMAESSPMGGAQADFDGDGRLDLVLSGIGFRDLRMGGVDIGKANEAQLLNNASSATQLLLQNPDGTYRSEGVQAGIARPLSETGQTMVSWTVRPLDFDFDGRLDMLVTHGYDWGAFLLADDGGMRPVLFRNQGNGTFADLSAQFGIPAKQLGRAVATADLDGDGDQDLLLGGESVQPLLMRNEIKHGGHWLKVRLRGRLSNRQGLGAVLALQTNLGTRLQPMTGIAPAHTGELPEIVFALPDGEVPQALTVRWPSGYDRIVKVEADTSVLVEEPPLVELSARHVKAGGQVTVTARSFGTDGQPDGKAVTIELSAAAQGLWAGPQTCAEDGACTRTWLAKGPLSGQAPVVVAVAGKAWLVRPVLRW